MSKNKPKEGQSPSIPQKSPRLGFLRRHRGKIALVLGLAIGAGYQHVADSLEKVLASDEGRTELQAKLIKSAEETKSPCAFREGTFLADSHAYNKFCMTEGGRKPATPEEGSCESVSDREKRIRDEDMESGAIIWIESIKEDEGRSDQTCNVDKSSSESDSDSTESPSFMAKDSIASTKEFYPLEQMSEPYLSLLREFDPDTFEFLRRRTFILKPEHPVLMAGVVKGPVSIVCDQFVPSKHGQYNLMGFLWPLNEIDLDQLLKEGNKEKIKQFISTINVVAHEFSHVRNIDSRFSSGGNISFDGFDDFCSKSGLPHAFKEELIAYYKGAKMVEFVAQKYPAIQEVIEEVAGEEPIEHQMAVTSTCGLNREEEMAMFAKQMFQLEIRLQTAYLEAKRQGQWSEFKDLVMNDMLVEQFGLPYIVASLRQNGEQACLASLNKEFRVIMNSDSPEELLQK